jgi:hypothetical protein
MYVWLKLKTIKFYKIKLASDSPRLFKATFVITKLFSRWKSLIVRKYLLLGRVLELDAVLVGSVERHLELVDSDGHLLLDLLNLVAKARLRLLPNSYATFKASNSAILVACTINIWRS